jgi:hypothetical protein
MSQDMAVSAPKSQGEEAITPIKMERPKIRLLYNPDKEAEHSEKTAGTVVDKTKKKHKSRIGWFKYYKAIELIITDKDGNKKTFVSHKWTKIPTPQKKAQRAPK